MPPPNVRPARAAGLLSEIPCDLKRLFDSMDDRQRIWFLIDSMDRLNNGDALALLGKWIDNCKKLERPE